MRPNGVADAQTVEIPSPPKELNTGTHMKSRHLPSRTSVLNFPRSLPEPTPGSDLLKVSLCLNLSVGTESLPSVHRLRLSA